MGLCENDKAVYIFLTIIVPYICIKLWNAKVIILSTVGIYLILYGLFDDTMVCFLVYV